MPADSKPAQLVVDNDLTLADVVAVVVETTCTVCKGRKRLPGGRYVHMGEVVPCAACAGRGVTRTSITLAGLKKLLTEIK